MRIIFPREGRCLACVLYVIHSPYRLFNDRLLGQSLARPTTSQHRLLVIAAYLEGLRLFFSHSFWKE